MCRDVSSLRSRRARIQVLRGRSAGAALSALHKIVAVVVTYNPAETLEAHLRAIRAQVGQVLIVDNGSANVSSVRKIAEIVGCECIFNTNNLGIATALNQAASVAIEQKADWLAMFDQDSEIPAAAIDGLLDAYRRVENPEKIAILAMSHRDRGTGHDYHLSEDILSEGETTRTVKTTITSGSMVHLAAYKALGPFDERLFIDSVDLEYCLRARERGYSIVEARHVHLKHSIGKAELRTIFGRQYILTHHSAERRYYITRNQLIVMTRYMRSDPRWSFSALVHLARLNVAVLILETDRAKKLVAMLQGVIDFGLRRYGRRRSFRLTL
jgi:rhamnosyltransferase